MTACGRSGAATAGDFTDAERGEAKKVFETICVTCHGLQGKGDGPGSAALDPKPRNLRDPAWQRSVTDIHIRNAITMGGAAVGKSPVMPAQPQLKSNPRVLDALIYHVRCLAKDATQ
jgi:mono/diheme cytochrome c family protein